MNDKKLDNIAPSSWPFKLDSVESYAFWKNAFSKEECLKIIKIAKKIKSEESKIIGNSSKDYRKSNVTWLSPNQELEWVYRKLTDIIEDLNSKYFKFNIYGFNERLQFTHYKSPEGKYKKHVDRIYNFLIRKLSVSVQLSDPKNYQGGELILYQNEEGVVMHKEQGDLILFPSFVMHEVKKVTKGERFSLVGWVTGESFK
jgi:PKHD-type hydroxylase